MRYHLALSMLLAMLLVVVMLPVMNVLAAPVPDPSAILDIGPPPKGKTAKEHRESEIHCLTHGIVTCAYSDPVVRKLPSVAPSLRTSFNWLANNIRARPENGGRRIRLTFRAGTRAEQVAILNTTLRDYIRFVKTERIQIAEEWLIRMKEAEPRLLKLIKEEQNPINLKDYLEEQAKAKDTEVYSRAQIARLKQVDVIKWAK